ncbi:hypothetical protein [Nostoc sp.]|uniref:hypothetical protein n=1 Tax=Nostoc sp. TaxID=1180 RepID=UPI002FF7E948
MTDMLHPIHILAIKMFLNGDVRHRRGSRSAVPMLLTRCKRDTGSRCAGWIGC